MTLRRTSYDRDAAAVELARAAPDLPGLAGLLDNVLAPSSDAEALEVFGETVRVQQSGT